MLAGVEGHTGLGTERVLINDLQAIGRQACLRSGIAYLARSRGATRVQRSCRKLGRYGPNTASKKGSATWALRAIVLAGSSDAHFGPPIDHATKSISGPCRGRATPSKPRANRLSEGRSGYLRLGGRRSAGRRRRRSAAAAVGRPVGRPGAVTMRSVGRAAVSVCGFSFSRADVKTPEFRGSFSLKLRELCQI